MKGLFKLAAPLIAALAVAACNSGSSGLPGAAGMQNSMQRPGQLARIPSWQAQGLAHAACPQVVGKPTCLALVVDKGVNPACVGSSCGIAPKELQARYNLPSATKGNGQTVALVDAYDEPTASSDLATYRTEFGLGTAKFNKYNETGQQSNYPEDCATASAGWCIEMDLDIEMVSASCPNCTIDLIETDGSITGMETAEATAVTLGATIVSNSWICYQSTDCGDSSFGNYFDTKNIAYLASSGDDRYNENGAPEALGSVISVGGTQITGGPSNYNEVIWSDAGGGCSNNGSGTGVTKPSWQKDPDCTYRTDSDVSAQAGLSPGVAEYCTQENGWFAVGGTSVASPLTGGIIALAGNAAKLDAGKTFWKLKKKKLKKDIHAITSGNDGSCGGEYLCTAGTNQFGQYSGPGGWGTPNGIKAY